MKILKTHVNIEKASFKILQDNFEILESQIKTSDLPEESFQWYLDLRRYGSVPHGGFGMGIERVVSWICGLDHVRESIPYPRMLHRLKP